MASEVEIHIVDLIPSSPHFSCPSPGPQSFLVNSSGGDLKTVTFWYCKNAAIKIQYDKPVSAALQKFNVGRSGV